MFFQPTVLVLSDVGMQSEAANARCAHLWDFVHVAFQGLNGPELTPDVSRLAKARANSCLHAPALMFASTLKKAHLAKSDTRRQTHLTSQSSPSLRL